MMLIMISKKIRSKKINKQLIKIYKKKRHNPMKNIKIYNNMRKRKKTKARKRKRIKKVVVKTLSILLMNKN